MQKPADSAPAPRRSRGGRLAGVASLSALTLLLSGLSATSAVAAEVTHSIAEVQGPGASTPLAGQTVTVEGVVTADYRGASGYRGIVVQTQGSGGETDATSAVSDGLFVYLGSANPSVEIGDLVRVTGEAGEYFGQTQVSATSVGATELVEAGVEIPAAAPLPPSVVGDAREAFENQLVVPTGDYYVSSSHQLSNYGTLWLSPGAPAVKSTETADAGPEADAIAAANRASRILLDDGYSIQVGNNSHPGEQPYYMAEQVVRNGDAVSFPTPFVLAYGFDDWRLQPTTPLTDASPDESKPVFTSANPRPAEAPAVGGDFQVGSFNVYNYFTTLRSANSDARGATTAAEFEIQKSKIVAAINGLGAEVVVLQEIENSVKLGEPADEALADLVSGLNAAAGEGTWDYVATPSELADPSVTDFISNAIIFKPAAVTEVGDSFTDLDPVWDIARKPIGQTFESVDTGKVFTVIANHFKSKGGDGEEPADGQGQFNAERVAMAQRLTTIVDDIVADPQKSEDVFLVGDFNAYSEEDPIQVFTGAGYVDLVADRTDGQYTYTFDGELGSLDHIVATPSLAEYVTGAGVWSINSPEWAERGYFGAAAEAGTVYRSSDHDPIVVGVSSELAPVEIDILTINDFHGRLGAAAQLGGMVDAYRAENPNTSFVSAGDNIGASTFDSFIQNDQPTIDVLNEIGLDASALGNHEFDKGRADVDERILEEADWPYLAANLYDTETGEPAYEEYFVQELGGVRVGYIGAVTEALPELVSPAGIETIEVRPVVDEVNRVAEELSDGDEANGEADVLVLLVHEGAATADISSLTDDSAFGEIVTGVSPEIAAILSGHTHLEYAHEVEVPGMEQPRLVIGAGEYGETYGHVDLTVDPETGDIVTLSGEVLPLEGFEPDPEVAAIVAEAEALADELGSVSVGEIEESLYRAVQSDGSENRGGESTLGNFVADVQLWAAEQAGAQIAFMNPGGLRADLVYESSGEGDPDGNVTYAEAAAVQPFANTLVTMDLTGEQIRMVLEEQWQPEGASRPFLKLGVSEGLVYTYDPTAPQGSRISSITLNGEPLDPEASYRVVANSFLAAGGDNFATLAEGADRADSGRIDLQAMVDYFEQNEVVGVDPAQRSVGVVFSEPGPYATGQQVTLELSSLLFSRGVTTDATVEVSLGGEVLGTAPIDPTIVDTTDEQGRASVTFTVPAGLSGPQSLLVTVPETGTSVTVPIEVVADPDEEAIESNKEPRITGAVRVGKTVSVNEGHWSVTDVDYSYQWNRDGEPIEGATGERYRIVGADAGSDLTVTVTASAEGYSDGSATSGERTVKPAPRGFFGAIAAAIEDALDELANLLEWLFG
ncbi:ExeM/NucH family extracellular endonuclease [Salinibacterium sp. SYSU T00001]|uniref:ExeM/NucH family extracellular endonuclease n=1 Tax=Homoserinimonas sedimenticola TaxID=2986805 RepID=UPI0022361BD4|nr:ExeM/NucH family extracellular endonuclease [Salinibacterium sedimenticola]MCW4385468.1 ExeM/NucH family extracellular endonuclease [Salinibacterium sedimenticola]